MRNSQCDKLFLAFLWFAIKSPQDKQCPLFRIPNFSVDYFFDYFLEVRISHQKP